MELAAILVGVAVAIIYYRQLDTMQGQLREMQGGGKQTDQMLCLIRQQLDQITKQAADTHTLAVAAGDQAKAAKTASSAMTKQVDKLQAGVNQTARLAKASEDATEKQTRPWIGIDGPIELDGTGVTSEFANLTIKLGNYGQSPGIVPANLAFGFTIGGTHGGWWEQYHICEDAERPLHETNELKRRLDTVFPGNDGVIVEHASAKYYAGDPRRPKLILIGCIAYQNSKGNIYFTRVGYSPTRSEKTAKDGTKFWEIDGFERFWADFK